MTRRRLGLLPATMMSAAVLVAGLLAGCSAFDGSSTPDPAPTPREPDLATSTPEPMSIPPAPEELACYRLGYPQALAPTNQVKPAPCGTAHTALTFEVGPLDTVVDGHLLAVDSRHVQEFVAERCPQEFGKFVGGTLQDQRMTMLRAVWFTPTVKQSDRGADWYRCDVIALAGDGALARLTGRMSGVLDTPEGRAEYAMCGTAEPGAADFERVVCTRSHSWKAISTFTFEEDEYPGEQIVRSQGETACEDAGRNVAADSLNFQWGYEWPTEEQWDAGQNYGLCWAPD